MAILCGCNFELTSYASRFIRLNCEGCSIFGDSLKNRYVHRTLMLLLAIHIMDSWYSRNGHFLC